jgi:hypothetical protein
VIAHHGGPILPRRENTRPWLTDLVSQAGLRIPRSQATEIGASIRAAAAMVAMEHGLLRD